MSTSRTEKRQLGLILFLAALLVLSACSHFEFSNSQSDYRDSAMNDGNRAPAGFAPKEAPEVSQALNPMTMQTQADFYYAKGEAYSMDSQYQKAIESFRMVQVYDPKSAQVPLRLAAEYVKLGLLSQALENAQLAVEKNPKFVDARLVLGGLYASLKNPTKAILEFQEALRLDPKHEEAHLYLGAVYAENNQPELAVKIFEKLSKLESYQNTHLAFHYIGRVRAEQGTKISRRQAEEAFKKALSLKPDHLESNLALGALWREQKKDVQALNIFEKFQKEYGPSLRMAEVLTEIYLQAEKFDLALDQLMILEKNSDETLNAKLRIAMILIQKKNYKEAISRLQEIIQQVPESDKIRFYLAAVLEETGEFSRALEHFKRIPPESQFFGESIVHAAYILKKEKKFEEAIRLLEPAVKARPELPQLIAVLASLLDDRDDLPRAQRILAEGLKKFPENTQLWFFNGSVQDRLGKKEESLQSMQKVVDLDPNHIQGLNYLAYTLADLGRDLSKAENLVKRALAMEPHDGFILDTYGWIKFKQGRFSEAVKTLERAFQLQPDEAIIAQHLGDAYQKVRVFQKAQAMYRRAIELEADPKKKSAIEIKSLALEKQIGLERSAASSP